MDQRVNGEGSAPIWAQGVLVGTVGCASLLGYDGVAFTQGAGAGLGGEDTPADREGREAGSNAGGARLEGMGGLAVEQDRSQWCISLEYACAKQMR